MSEEKFIKSLIHNRTLTVYREFAISLPEITLCSRVLEKQIITQLFKKLPAFYGTPRFITMFTTAHH